MRMQTEGPKKEVVESYDQESFLAPAKYWQDSPNRCVEQEFDGQAEVLNDGSIFVSSSPAMLAIRQQIEKIAEYDIPVLILGESGSGKEVVARLLHTRSDRARRPFLKVNCAALPGTLLESELFGYERGAFTGAVRSNPGKFEICNS
jgi:transcriptional regulator with GAF, ATPase, and Fis domain